MTWLLTGALGVIDGFRVITPHPADVATLGSVHTLGYIDLVRRASRTGFPLSVGHGLGIADEALIAGGSVDRGEVDRAVDFCGGLHPRDGRPRLGFCVYDDAALAIAAMLQAAVRKVAHGEVDAPSRRRRRLTETVCRPLPD